MSLTFSPAVLLSVSGHVKAAHCPHTGWGQLACHFPSHRLFWGQMVTVNASTSGARAGCQAPLRVLHHFIFTSPLCADTALKSVRNQGSRHLSHWLEVTLSTNRHTGLWPHAPSSSIMPVPTISPAWILNGFGTRNKLFTHRRWYLWATQSSCFLFNHFL